MKTCLQADARVWLSHSDNPRRKLAYSLELIENDERLIFVNPVRVNRVVEEALQSQVVQELSGYDSVQREVPFHRDALSSSGRSRADFRLSAEGREDCIVEVKSVTLTLGEGRTAFPDSVSARGARHLVELQQVKRSGRRAVLLYCASRQGAESVEAARQIDPAYAEKMDEARAAGVEIFAYACQISPQEVRLSHAITVL